MLVSGPGLRKLASREEFLAQVQTPGVIHCEHLNCCASNRRPALNPLADYLKMIQPLILAGMEERHDLIRNRVDAG